MNSIVLTSFYRLGLLLAISLLVSASGSQAQDALPESVLQDQLKRIETIARVSPSVVAIFPPSGKGGGSGVLISPDGLALTNFHVVRGAGPFLKCGLNDGNIYDAVLIGIDPTGDVAIIKLLGRDDFPTSTLGDSDQARAGDWAFAMGNPFLLAADFTPTLTFGMISGVKRYQYPAGSFLEYTDCIQVDTSINPGNSGGPLYNTDGELIGINGRISVEKRGRVNAGAGYAISINQIKNFSDHLLSGRVVDHATLGATVRTDEFSNVVVDSILPNCDAARQGLRSGDEIVSFGGRAIGSVNQFKNAVGIYPKGWKTPLTYRRDGQRTEIIVRLEALHSTGELLQFAGTPDAPEKPEKKPPGIPLHHAKPAPQIPKQYAHLYQARQGFANYYFNKQHQQRLIDQLKTMGNFSDQESKWTFTGTLPEDVPFRMVISEFASLLEIPTLDKIHLLDIERPDTFQAGLHSEGMLMGFYQLHRLLTQGAEGFTEFYYIGSEKIDGTGPKVDILMTMESGRDVRWYFDKKTKQLLGWDTFIDPEFPECRIRVTSWSTDAKHAQPTEWAARSAGNPSSVYRLEKMEIETFQRAIAPQP
ncbi:MAG: trypsin-like peptidase domain-containing protein [Planctomycetaceae bacterium]|nr:trypsin-like peptidase domain-containing protein [Planctomycetaceae bacterium]